MSGGIPYRLGLTAAMVLLGLSISLAVWGDLSTVAISNAKLTVTSSSSTTLDFPISRGGDSSYDAFVQYQTRDGTAAAGTDYMAASGSLVIPAGATGAMIPVTVAGRGNNPADKTLQMLLVGGGGARSFTSSFSAQKSFATGPYPTSVTVADINGDGRPDLITANNGGLGSVSVLLNTTVPGAATLSFAAPKTFPLVTVYPNSGPNSVIAADVNGDGRPDLITADDGSGFYGVTVLLNTTPPGATTPSFATPQTFTTAEPCCLAVADFNGDGKPDFVVSDLNGQALDVLLNTTPPGAATPSFARTSLSTTAFSPGSVAAVDVNGDGKPDLIVANGDSTLGMMLNTTAPGSATLTFDAEQTIAAGNFSDYLISVTAADVNGDGKPDLLVADSGSGFDSMWVLLNTTTPGASTPTFGARETFASSINPVVVRAADVNGDGKPDLLVGGSVMLNTTAPGAAAASFAKEQIFAATGGVNVLADINGDGKPDVIGLDYGHSAVLVWLNTTAGTTVKPGFATQKTFVAGTEPSSVTPADVNGDGKRDLIVANAAANTVSVLLNTTAPGAATPSYAAKHSFATGREPTSVAAADINGDGKPDLIAANRGDSTVSVLLDTTAPGASIPNFTSQKTFATAANRHRWQ